MIGLNICRCVDRSFKRYVQDAVLVQEAWDRNQEKLY